MEIQELTAQLSEPLRKHFCKNYNVPIKIFADPYFTDRCVLFDEMFKVKEKLQEYIADVNSFVNDQAFLAYNNKAMQSVIDYLKSNTDMNYFSKAENMNKYAIPDKYRNLSSKDVWKDSCNEKMYVSIDLIKANFQALKHYSKNIFGESDSWEEFLLKFTDKNSMLHSKHLRQVIFGCVNPKRQIIYEKYLMCKILEKIEPMIKENVIYSLSNDEIILDVGECFTSKLGTLLDYIRAQIKGLHLSCHINVFSVHKIGKDMYKQTFTKGFSDSVGIKFKKVNHLMMPFVIRKFKEQSPSEDDFVFVNEAGNLCKFLENPLKN